MRENPTCRIQANLPECINNFANRRLMIIAGPSIARFAANGPFSFGPRGFTPPDCTALQWHLQSATEMCDHVSPQAVPEIATKREKRLRADEQYCKLVKVKLTQSNFKCNTCKFGVWACWLFAGLFTRKRTEVASATAKLIQCCGG